MIADHELRTQLTGPLFWVLLALLVAAVGTLNPVAMIRGAREEVDGVRAFANSMHALAPTFAMGGFFVYPFFAAMMAGLSVIRDDDARIGELLHSTPLTLAEYLLGKFAGVAGALAIAVAAHVAIVVFFREFGIGSAARGPFVLAAYVVPALLLTLPGVLWIAGLAFALGALTRRPMVVYALPTALFLLVFAVFWNWNPKGLDARIEAALVVFDPTGLRWLSHHAFATDRGFAYYNSAPLALDALMLVGRGVTLAMPAAAVFVAIRLLGRRNGSVSTRSRETAAAFRAKAVRIETSFRPLGDVAMTSRPPGFVRGTATILGAELRDLRGQPSLYLFAAFLMAVVIEFGGAESDRYGSPMLVTAGGLAVRAIPVVTLLVCLYLLFVIVESMVRERVTRFEAIAFATPVPTSAILCGKALAAATVIGALTSVCIAAGLTLLAINPGSPPEIWPLVLVCAGVLGPTFVLWTAFVTAVTAVVRQRAAALAIGIAALVLTAAQFIGGSMTWVTNWPLWGALRWTDFGVFPLNGEALLLNRALAIGLSAFLLVVAMRTFARTERDPAVSAKRRAPRRLFRSVLRLAPLAAIPTLTGAFLAIQIREGFQGATAQQASLNYQEDNAARWRDAIPPTIRHVDLALDLEPSARRLHVVGSYLLVNATGAPLSALSFTVPRALGEVAWTIASRTASPHRSSGLDVLPLAQSLAPGDSLRLGFRYTLRSPDGYTRNGGGATTFILPVGVLLSTHRGDFLPIPGFDATRSTNAPVQAAARSAPEQPSGFNRGVAFAARMSVRAPDDFTVNGAGTKTSESVSDGFTNVVWETDHPVAALSLIAGRWDVQRSGRTAVYFHPQHEANVGQILNTLVAARRNYSQWFFPYPWAELRINEYPDLETQATAYPTNIAFSEGIGFLTAGGTAGGLAFTVTAHEAAHQWWGHLLAAAEGPGTGFLVEGMADYSALLLHESENGREGRVAFAKQLEREYLDGRQESTEAPILATREGSAATEAVLQKKGAWVMWMLHNELGRERTFAGLRRLIDEHQRSGAFATPQALIATLRSEARDPAAYDAFARQWFESVVLPEFRIGSLSCSPRGELWECAARVRNIGTGTAEVEFAAQPESPGTGDGRVRASLGAGRERELHWTLRERPDRIVADPDVLVLQRNRDRAVSVFNSTLH